MKNKIVLVGYMGAGKSVIGENYSKRTNFEHIDLDAFIENKEKMSIQNIFLTKGEIYFRKMESKYLNEILTNNSPMILSLGGGTPCYSNNHLVLDREDVLSVFLKTNVDTIFNRISKEKENRPLISNIKNEELKTFIAQHLFERNYFYQFANYTIDVNGKSIEQIVSEIIELN